MAKKKMDIEKKIVLTVPFRLSFPHLLEPHTFEEGGKLKFSFFGLIPKKTDISAMQKAAANAQVEVWGADKTDWPVHDIDRRAFRDGDKKEDLTGYKGMHVFKASATKRPALCIKVDGVTTRVAQDEIEDTFYPGCWCVAKLIAFAYDKGKTGVGFSVMSILKVRDDEEFSGRGNPEKDFADIEIEEVEAGADENAPW